jgi:hypothetical protein
MSAIRIAVVSALTVVSLLGGAASGRHLAPQHTHTLAGPIICCDSAPHV